MTLSQMLRARKVRQTLRYVSTNSVTIYRQTTSEDKTKVITIKIARLKKRMIIAYPRTRGFKAVVVIVTFREEEETTRNLMDEALTLKVIIVTFKEEEEIISEENAMTTVEEGTTTGTIMVMEEDSIITIIKEEDTTDTIDKEIKGKTTKAPDRDTAPIITITTSTTV